MTGIVVRADGPTGDSVRVVFVDSEGTETDISHCVSAVTIQVAAREFTRATLDVLPAFIDLPVEIEHLIVRDASSGEPE